MADAGASLLAGLDAVQAPTLQPLDAPLKTSTLQSMGGAFREAWNSGPTSSMADMGTALIERSGLDPTPSKILSPDEANAQTSHLGLKFSQPITQRYLNILASERRSKMVNEATAAAGGNSLTRFAAGTAAFGLDPANLLVGALLPQLGVSKFVGRMAAPIEAAVGRLATPGVGVVAGRAAMGAVEGGLTAAAVEPLQYAGGQVRGDDYTMWQSMMNMFTGGAFGMGIHVGGGWLRDAFGGAKLAHGAKPTEKAAPIPGNLTEALANAPHEVKQSAFETAVTQAGQGRDVNVNPVLDQLPQIPNTPLLGNVHTMEPLSRLSKPTTVRYELAELADIRTANPTIRESAGSGEHFEATVREHAKALIPERMGEATQDWRGAPIVDDQNRLVGNAADMTALERAHAYDYAGARRYREFLGKRLGEENLKGYENPVLVRRTVPEGTPRTAEKIQLPTNVARETTQVDLSAPMSKEVKAVVAKAMGYDEKTFEVGENEISGIFDVARRKGYSLSDLFKHLTEELPSHGYSNEEIIGEATKVFNSLKERGYGFKNPDLSANPQAEAKAAYAAYQRGEPEPFDRNNPKHVQRVVGRRVPSVVQRIKELGGINWNAEGLRAELDHAVAGSRGMKLRLSNKRGHALDELAMTLEHEGYIKGMDRYGEGAGPHELLSAIAKEAGGEKVYPHQIEYDLAAHQLEAHYGDMPDQVAEPEGEGDPTVVPADMAAADTVLSAPELTTEEGIDELMRRVGEPDAATARALADVDERIANEPAIRDAIHAAARCVLDNG